MRLSASHKYDLLLIIIDCAIQAAEKNGLGIGVVKLKGLKQSIEMESVDQIDKKFKDAFKGIMAQLSIIFGIPVDKKWRESFKFSTKKWKEINHAMDVDVEGLSHYVKEQLPFLAILNDKAIATSSSEALETKILTRNTGHIRKRSRTEGNVSVPPSILALVKPIETQTTVSSGKAPGSTELKTPGQIEGMNSFKKALPDADASSSNAKLAKNSSPLSPPSFPKPIELPKPTQTQTIGSFEKAPGSAELRTKFQRDRGLSFYKPLPSEAEPSSSNVTVSKKKSSEVPPLAIPQMSLVNYFSGLFAHDAEKTAEFVIALATDTEKLAWGIQVLNAAGNTKVPQIAETLFNNLTTNQLLVVFSELFKLEKKMTWCRGNQLFKTLKQCYLASEEVGKFREFLWNELIALKKPISKIHVKRSSMILHPASFSAKQEHITELQEQFSGVLRRILSPQNFPPLMQQIIKQAYIALMNRNDYASAIDREFLAFVLLRFINPIFVEEAHCRVTKENFDLDDPKVLLLKTWYNGTLIFAIQSLASLIAEGNSELSSSNFPGVSVVNNAMPSAALTLVEKELKSGEQFHQVMFGSITQNQKFREEILNIIKEGLQLDKIVIKKPTYNDTKIPALNEASAVDKLDDLLQEKYSGYSFRTDGTVTPGRAPKPSILAFFPPLDNSDSEISDSESASDAVTPR